MSIWLLAYHWYHYYQKEVVTAKENAQLSLIAKQAQLDNLSAQLNPHFLFNSLNSIKSLVIENPNVARRSIDLLSDLLRSSLYEKGKGLISINNELALVYDYIELEKMRFEERLQLKTNIDNDLINYKIPTLSIQLLVENAIKHGTSTLLENGKIEIKGGTITVNGEMFVQLFVIDNAGTYQVKENITGLGLQIVDKRIKNKFGETFGLEMSCEPGISTTAKILFPFIMKTDEKE